MRAYDPDGDGSEHDDEAGKATDGDLTTYWRTEGYHAQLSEIGKSGIGLVLDAGRAVAVSRITVSTDTPGFEAEIRAGSALAHLEKVSPSQTVASTSTFRLTGGRERYYVLWITKLPPELRAHVNEIEAS